MLALLKLIPVTDWLYAGIAFAVISFGLWGIHHERQVGAERIKVAVAAESARVLAKATADNAAWRAAYDQKNEANQNAYAKSLAVASSSAADLSGKLREYAARRCGSPLSSDTVRPGEPASPAAQPGSDARIQQAGDAFIAACAADAAELTAAQIERESVTTH